MEYSEEELRGQLDQYANDRIESFEQFYGIICVKFKEGYGSSWKNGWVKTVIPVTNLTDLKEACTPEYLKKLQFNEYFNI